MSKIKVDIDQLKREGVIDEATADRILGFYTNEKDPSSGNRLFLIFGVFGALMIGLGIILIIAHNWDQLSRLQKTIIAFIPMLLSQLACWYTLFKKSDSKTWRESSAVLLMTTMMACIAMISQIYHIEGDLKSYLLTCSLLSLPLIYIMRSKMTCLLYIGLIAWYGSDTFIGPQGSERFIYWALLGLAIPFYYTAFKKNPQGLFVSVMNWVLPISILSVFSTHIVESNIYVPIGYASLLASFYLFGNSKLFDQHRLLKNGYLIIGAIGTLILMIVMSFDFYWNKFHGFSGSTDPLSYSMILTYGFTLLALALLTRNFMTKENKGLDPMAFVFLVLIGLFGLAKFSPHVHFLVNILIFGVGIMTILKGVKSNHLAILNFGLLMITSIIIARFFDTDFSFVMRGVVFILVGIAFFMANMWMLKNRKST